MIKRIEIEIRTMITDKIREMNQFVTEAEEIKMVKKVVMMTSYQTSQQIDQRTEKKKKEKGLTMLDQNQKMIKTNQNNSEI